MGLSAMKIMRVPVSFFTVSHTLENISFIASHSLPWQYLSLRIFHSVPNMYQLHAVGHALFSWGRSLQLRRRQRHSEVIMLRARADSLIYWLADVAVFLSAESSCMKVAPVRV